MLNKVFSRIGIFFIYTLSLLPMQVLYLFATLIYWLVYHVFGYRKAVVRTNLKNSFPEKSADELIQIEKKILQVPCCIDF
ncbi:LpxL/LpxP family acyltransferase [Pedobacter lusitanus]|uniref:LpxL/LpxP family acyltransferase n=1 Tax=Pedobacter lusitanus TaxID=1503925 RepID=UPI0021CDF25C|nr:hypothetical protein [Pedobacter lusitanus]